MTIAFWGIAALLLAGALLFILPPLLRAPAARLDAASPLQAYREQLAHIEAERVAGRLDAGQHERALEELQTRVIEEVGEDAGNMGLADVTPSSPLLVLVVALLVPLGALSIYGLLGTPGVLHRGFAPVTQNGQDAHSLSGEQIETMVRSLAEKLEKNPDDAAGWHMLARSYAALDRLTEAAKAYERANQLSPGNPQLLSDYADVLASVSGNDLAGRPTELVLEALKADPKHPKALALAGTAAFDIGDFGKAAAHWKDLLAILPPATERYKAIEDSIAEAEAAEKGRAVRGSPSAPEGAPRAGFVEGTVALADSVKGSVPAGATLFVYARGTDGNRMPLAIVRVRAGAFPYSFHLDDSLAMTPQARISERSEVMVVARVSRTGNATPQPGDLTGSVGPVKLGSRGVSLLIDQVVK